MKRLFQVLNAVLAGFVGTLLLATASILVLMFMLVVMMALLGHWIG